MGSSTDVSEILGDTPSSLPFYLAFDTQFQEHVSNHANGWLFTRQSRQEPNISLGILRRHRRTFALSPLYATTAGEVNHAILIHIHNQQINRELKRVRPFAIKPGLLLAI